jgi:O-antigen/teichoic acid export membrane protein
MGRNSKNSYSHILKYTGLFGGIQFLNLLISIVRNKFVALILGPLGMGLISLFNSTINLFSNTTNLGISMSAVKNIAESYENRDAEHISGTISMIRSWSLITAVAGTLLCIIASPLLNAFTFTWGDHTLHFICLSPIVALMAVTGGETAILKGTGHLNALAGISIINVIIALLTSVPIYYLFGEAGIIPSLIIISLCQMLLTIHTSYRLFPLSISMRKDSLRQGFYMVKLGSAFVIAGIFGSGADFVIRSFLNTTSSLDTVGLYNAGYMMTMVYAGMVFTAMETDYFPRLSAVNQDVKKRNIIINRQIEVSLLLLSPMLVAFMVSLPLLLPLLYSNKFIPVTDMIRITIIAMYFRTIKLPIAYLTLARGNSKAYLFLEATYDVIVIILTVVGFTAFGLVGAGYAITLTCIIDVCIILLFTYYKYRYVISIPVIKYFLIQFPIGIAAMLTMFIDNTAAYWIIGIILICTSTFISLKILQGKTSLWNKLMSKFKSYN